ncbi:hypothetical protein AVEN_12727-1 [Araneus ventricosus]|uniref:Uncharacterized protein n=1 Tax=Araneus ventricosus TaxID=182803 RepID=A0A4Y2AB58_ARAVE|nr:hypothetical protein AVEN_12727-1 [Araneus ventricosus]
MKHLLAASVREGKEGDVIRRLFTALKGPPHPLSMPVIRLGGVKGLNYEGYCVKELCLPVGRKKTFGMERRINEAL